MHWNDVVAELQRYADGDIEFEECGSQLLDRSLLLSATVLEMELHPDLSLADPTVTFQPPTTCIAGVSGDTKNIGPLRVRVSPESISHWENQPAGNIAQIQTKIVNYGPSACLREITVGGKSTLFLTVVEETCRSDEDYRSVRPPAPDMQIDAHSVPRGEAPDLRWKTTTYAEFRECRATVMDESRPTESIRGFLDEVWKWIENFRESPVGQLQLDLRLDLAELTAQVVSVSRQGISNWVVVLEQIPTEQILEQYADTMVSLLRERGPIAVPVLVCIDGHRERDVGYSS